MKPVRAMRILSILCLLFACTLDVYAQQFPVQVTPVLAPPYSLYLSDYASPEGNLQLIIQLRELNRPEYRVKLRLTIEGQGIIIRTKGSYLPPALVLQGGVTEILTGNDISHYFDPDHLDFSGISKSDFVRKGALPEGFYTFKFEAIDYLRNVTVSNTGFANAWIILNDPPIINLPFNEDKVVATDPQNVQFSWTPRHTASPNAAFSTEYEFTMVELYPDNRNPNDAIRVGRPIFVTQTTLTSLNYGITETLLIPGRRYAFRVRAYDTDGRDLFKNGGYSEVVVFQFGDACIPPLGVKAEALDESRFKLTWEESPIHTGYAIQFRKKGSSDWNDETALSTSAIVPGLQPSTTYEYRVSGTCGTIRGEYSALASITTTESDPTEFSCGVAPPVIDISTTPLQGGLKVLDIIKTADFDVIVTDVEAKGDSYTGTGKAMMPWFNLATVNVKFRGIKVNDDYRVYSGNVTTVYSKSSRLVLNVDLNNEENDEDKDGDGIPDDEEADYATPDTVTIPFDIEEITIDTSNPDVIVIVAEDGTTQEIPREKDDDGNYTDTVVKDSNGDTWIVGKDGKVSEGPSSGAPDALASLDEVDYTITFEGIADQQYGLDKKGDDSYGEYETATIRGEAYVVPWKSVETGRQDRVAAIAGDESTFPSAVGFKISGAQAPAQPSSDASMKEVFITGKSGGLEESLSAYVMVKESDDDEPQEVEVGKLNIATYDKVRRKVFLVPVNNANAQGIPSAATVQTELNRIYKQAVVEWDVELAPNFIYDEDVKGIDSEESDFLSSFPGRMQELNRTFANTTWVDANSYYLFFLNGTESRRTGFMPFKRKYGYIFLDNIGTDDTPQRVVAHELGHGAFRLRHTFSPEDKKADEGRTDNLMDYNRGTELKKYQWDLIHHPDNFNGWLEDDAESAYTNGEYFSKFLQELRCAYVSGQDIMLMPEKYKSGGNNVDVIFDYGLGAKEGEINGLKIRSAQWTAQADQEYIQGIQNPLIDPFKGIIQFGNFKILVRVPVYNMNSGITPFEHFKRYLFPSDPKELAGEFTQVLNTIVDKTDFTDNDLIRIKAIANCAAKFFTPKNKYIIIRKIADHDIALKESYEDLILDLLENYDGDLKTYSEELISYLVKDHQLLRRLFFHIDNVSGATVWKGNEENFDRFLGVIYGLWKDTKYAQYENYSYDQFIPIGGGDYTPDVITYDGKSWFPNVSYTNFYFGAEKLTISTETKYGKHGRLSYDYFQPILIVFEDKAGKSKVTQLEVPALFFAGTAKDDNLEKSLDKLGLTIDIVLTFSGVGNFAKLRHLTKLRQAGRIIFGTIEITSGAADIIIRYSDLCEGNEQFCQAFQEYNTYLQLGLLGSGLIQAKFASSRKKAFEEYEKHRDALIKKFGNDDTKIRELDNHFSDLKLLGTVNASTLTQLHSVPSSLHADAFNKLGNDLNGQYFLRFDHSIHDIQTPKTFLNEKGASYYDFILEGKYYVKYDLSTGRILLGSKEGSYLAFAQEKNSLILKNSVENLDEIRNHIILQAEKLKVIVGLADERSIILVGARIIPSTSKVSTFIGRMNDIGKLKEQLGDFKNVDVGEMQGGMNILNRPDVMFFDAKDQGRWMRDYNLPWVQRAINRGDDVYIASDVSNLPQLLETKYNGVPVATVTAHELREMIKANMMPKNITHQQWDEIKTYIKTLEDEGKLVTF